MRFGMVAALMLSGGLLVGAPVTRAALGADYYVSPGGDDGGPGTSPEEAWRSIARVNTAVFSAGDRILFEGGQAFAGNLYFDAADAGTAADPIALGSYGEGRATISAGAGTGLLAYNTGGYDIADLNFVGSGRTSNAGTGISFYADLGDDVRLERVRMDGVEVSGFGDWGIAVGGGAGRTGYRDVRVTHASAHDNARGGVITYAAEGAVNQDVYVGHCHAFNNPGVPGYAKNSGHGIVLGGVDGGVVERCVAHDNGWLCSAGEGPVGIWAYDSTGVTIQFNESYGNRTGGPADGGGFDLDGGVTNSLVQYNYSHDNDGAGYLLAEYAGAAPFAGNVVRYNISENDGRRNGYAGILVWGAGAAYQVTECLIHHNTVFVGESAWGDPRAVRFLGSRYEDIDVVSNLFVSADGVRLVEVPNPSSVRFLGNAYWLGESDFEVSWGGATYASLAEWASATGQEMLEGVVVGLEIDPMLTAPGAGGTIGDADALETLTAYLLQAGSPLLEAGLDLAALFGAGPGPRDFWGSEVPRADAPDIGAHEFVPQAGDTDLDGDVDATDLASLGLGWAPSGPDGTWASGDFDGDDDVDASDLAALGLGWDPSGGTAAPEPGTLALAGGGAVVALATRRRA